MSSKLSSSIISLIHHSKLNERGWWEKSIKNLIIGVIAEHDNVPITKIQVIERLNKNEIKVDAARFEKHFQVLCNEKVLVQYDDLFSVSNQYHEKFKEAYRNQIYVEDYAKNKFIALANQRCPRISSQEIWNSFYQKLLIPLVKENGAKVRDFINVGGRAIKNTNHFNKFIEEFAEDSDNMSSVINEFLEPNDDNIKAFIIRLLNAYFFIEASNLDQNALKEIYHLSEGKSKLDIYVDSNFMFSLLDLHENNSNEASRALLAVIEEAREKVNVQFHILPITFAEMQNVVYGNKMSLKSQLFDSPNLIYRASQIMPYGFKKKYYEKCREAGIRIDIEQYFEPYDKNLLITIQNRFGVRIDESDYSGIMDDVLSKKFIQINDDTLELRDFAIAQMKADGINEQDIDAGKLYDKILHDIRLWYIVADKRSANETPRTIRNWIITLDSKLLAFDHRKLRSRANQFSICLHPSDLMNILQFWLPRDEKLEAAMFENFRLPLMFKDYDEETESITLNILSAIALHENSENLSQENIAKYETENAIRSKIKSSTPIQEIAKLIKEFDELQSQKLKNDLIIEKEARAKIEKEAKIKERKNEEIQAQKDIQMLEIELLAKEKLKKHQISDLEEKIMLLNDKLRGYESQKAIADSRVEKAMNRFWSFFQNREKISSQIYSDYPDIDKIPELNREIKLLQSRLDRLNNPTIILCENKNDKLFNQMDIDGIKFIGIHNSHSVFINAKSDINKVCLRDLDLISEVEATNLKLKFPNLLVLNYYCFENYLYHPENIYEVLNGNIDIEKYKNDIIKQIIEKRIDIVASLDRIRNGYQELKEDGVLDKNARKYIYDCLHSEDFEKMYKYFSVKEHLDKSFLKSFLLNDATLSKTVWFKSKIKKIVTDIM